MPSSRPNKIFVEPLRNVDAERRRLYALAEVVGRGWAEFRMRAPSVPAELEAAREACGDVPDAWESLTPEQQHEGELIGQLDDLATLFEIWDEETAERPQ